MENKKICKKCGGRCCKWTPGAFHPDDFKRMNLEDTLLEGIVNDQFVIDNYDGVWYVMPQVIGKNKWGTCVFHTLNGCTLSYKRRPRECRMLEPKEGRCIAHSDKKECSEGWKPYKDLLIDLWEIS